MQVMGNRYCPIHRQGKRINWTLSSIVHSIVHRGGGLSALIAGSGLVVAASIAPAHAEGPADNTGAVPQSAQSVADSSDSLEEIIVTARRKSELLQDVPQTVTAVTTTELQQLNLQNLKDLSGVVPGLQIVQSSNRSLDSNTFRGVSFQPATGTQNTLGFYVNDTFVTNNFVTTSNFDIGQIEVLSGPQGTLRGEPSPSGSLTITTHRPDLERFGGYVTATGTAFDNTNENGAVNLPIIPGKLAVRLAALADDDDLDGVTSIHDPASPYIHTYAERASVRFEPIDAIEANVMYEHSYFHQNQYAQVAGPGAVGGVDPNAPANYNGPPIAPLQRIGVQAFQNTSYNNSDIVTGQLDWHVLGQVVSYDGSHYEYRLNNGDSYLLNAANQIPAITTANPVPREPSQFQTPSTEQQTTTSELRIASETPIFGFMDYSAGGFYKRTHNSVEVVQLASYLGGSFGSPLAPANPFIYNPNYTLQLLIHSPTVEKEFSEFAHVTFHLPFDTELTAGGRHIDYSKDGSIVGTLLPSGIFIAVPLAITCSSFGFTSTYPGSCNIPGKLAITNTTALANTPTNLRDHPWIYNVSLSHKFDPSLLGYVSTGSSWRPPAGSVGIFNAANDPVLNQLLHLKSEKSTDIEGGFKWTFLENRARLNIAYYHQKFNGFIYSGLPSLYLSDNGSGTPSVANFSFNSNPDAVVNGVDLDTGFRLTRQWTFDLTANYSNGHLTGSEVPCSPPSGGTTVAAFPAGTHVFLCPSHASTSVAPNFNTSAQSEYDLPLPGASGIDSFIRGLYTFYGRNPHASQFYVAPSYGILNLYAGLRSPDGAWEGAIFAKNALDAEKVLTLSTGTPAIDAQGLSTMFGSSGYYNTSITPRREYGLTVTYSFGSR
jgi:iron complex outermembrane receptor protein